MSSAPAANASSRHQASATDGLAALGVYMARTLRWYDEILGVVSDCVVDRYVNRLAAMAEGPAQRLARFPGSLFGRLNRAGLRLGWMAVSIGRGLALLPYLLEQFFILRRSWPGQTMVAFGLASNRTRLSPGMKSVRENLILMTQPLRASAQAGFDGDRFKRDIAGADAVLLFDSLLASHYWSHRRRCRSENVVIVDGMFLIVFAALSLLTRPRHAAGSMWRLFEAGWKQARRFPRSRRRGAVSTGAACALAGYGYWSLLGWSLRVSGILLTRNSTLLELLRAYLVWAPSCSGVCEIMHGIPAEHEAQFFEQFLDAGDAFGAREKLGLVPQVPYLPLFGIFRQQLAFKNAAAINPRVTILLAELAAKETDIPAAATAEWRRLAGAESARRPLVVALFGTDRLAGRLDRSATFRAECMLLAMFRRASNDLGIPCALVYVPHPSGATPPGSHATMRRNRVEIGTSSLLAWLVADLAVSLYSSATFEAAYFGCRAFLPLIPSDGLFAPYLGLVNHPRSPSRQDLERAVRDAVRECAAAVPRPGSKAEEVRGRLTRMGLAS